MHDIFISYKVEELEEATRVRDYLQRNGLKCWMAPDSITGGASYASEINSAIKSCKAFVLILSPLAQTSIHITREYSLADKYGKTAFPFCIKHCDSFTGDFEYLLSATQYYTAYEDWDKAAEKMLKDLKAKIGITTQENNKKENEVLNTTSNNTIQNIPKTETKPFVYQTPDKAKSIANESEYCKYCIFTFICGLISCVTLVLISLCVPAVLTFVFAYKAKAQRLERPDLKGRGFLIAGIILNLIMINIVAFVLFPFLGIVSLVASVLFLYTYIKK